jgi:hypothetical protein
LNIPNEETIPLYTDHKSICRFEGRTKDYASVFAALEQIATLALKGKEQVETGELN